MKPKSTNRFLSSLRTLLNSSGITLAMALTASPLFAAGGSWNVDAAGNWETASNWTPTAVPGTAEGDAVNLLFNISAARTITIGTGVTATVGDLNIGDPTATVFGYTLAAGGTGSIRLDGTGTTDATIDFTSNVINTVSAPITLVDNGVFRSNVVSQHVFSGVISGTGRSLTLNNDVDGVVTVPTLTSGQFALNAANTFTGGTNISDVRVSTNNATGFGTGAVNITGAGQVFVSGATTLANSFTLNSTGWAETGFNFGALRLESGATVSGAITLAQNSSVGSNTGGVGTTTGAGNLRGVISGAFSLNKAGPGTIIINNTTAANTYSGGTTISQGVLSIGTGGTGANTARTDALGTGMVTVNSTGTLQLWIQNSTAFTIANNLTVNGGTLRNEDGIHTLSGTLAVGTSGANIYSRYDGKNLTLSGVISGSGPVTLDADASTILLTNSNTYSGGTTLSRGRVSISSGTGFGTGSLAITSNAATTVTIANNAATTVANNISLPAPTAAANYNFVKNTASTTTGTQLNLTGVISGGGSNATLLLNSSTGGDTTTTYRLAGTNTFTGKVQIFRGGVVVTNTASLGASTNTLELNSNNSTLGDLRFENAITLQNPVSLLSAATISSNGLNPGLSGVISGSAALTKVGAGTLTLSGSNTATGATTISAGTLGLDYTNADNSKLADAATLTLREGTTLNLSSSFATSHVEVVSATNVAGNASISRSGASVNKIALGAVNNSGGTLNVLADNIATTTTPLINGLLPGYITVNGGLATKDGSDNIVAYTGYTDVNRLGGSIADAPGANVRIIEAGTSGDVTLATSGTTNIGTLSNTGTAAPTLVEIGAGNTLRLNDLGSIQAGTNGLTLSNGTLTAGGLDDTPGTLDILNSSAIGTVVTSVIADNGTGSVGLTKSGTGLLTLSATNTYTGTTTVNGGTLALTGGTVLPDSAAVSLSNNSGATLRLDSSETIGSLSSGAASTVNLQANTLTVSGSSTTTAAGNITGTGSLVKQGSGTLVLSGTNSYTGGTTVSNGSLQANSTGALTGIVSIASGGTLALNAAGSNFANTLTGNGVVAVTLGSAATTTTLSGNLSGFTGTLSLSTGGKLNLSSTASNQLAPSATIRLNSGATLYQFTTATSLANPLELYGGTTGEAFGQVRLEGGATLSGAITLFGDSSVGNIAATVGSITGNIGQSGGSYGLSKVGAGSITLSGTNTYTGPTTLSAGTLNLTGSVSGSALNQAATTTLSGEGSVASLSTTGATNLVINAATSGALTASGAFTPGAGAVTTVSFPTTTPTSGTVRVLNYGSTTATAANFALAGATGFRTPTFDVQPTFTNLTLGVASLTWTGIGGGNWDVNTTTNWNDTTPAASRFFIGDSVTFDDSAAGTAQSVALTTTVQPASITFNNSTDTYSLTGTAGAIIGTTGITKNGTANVTLAGGTSQAYTGPIAVNAGTLTMGSATAFGRTSGITIANGAAVDVNGQTPATVSTGGYAYTIAGSGPSGAGAIVNSSAASLASNAGVRFLTLSANASIGGIGRFDFGFANAAGVGAVDGAGFTLTKVGTNQIVARGPATNINYVVSAGTLSFEDFDSASGTNPITVSGTGTLGSFGARTIGNNISFSAGTTLTNLGGATSTWTGTLTLAGDVNVNTANASIVIDGGLAGTGNLVRAGGNTLFLQNSATGFSGKIVNNGGTLRVEGPSALGTATGADVLTMANNSTLQSGTVTGASSGTIGSATQGITQLLGATYDATAGNTLTIDGPITATGTLNKANNSGHVIFNRAITSTGGVSANGGTQTYNGNLSLAGAFDVGTNIITNLNSPSFASAGMNFWTGTTNIAIGSGTTTLVNVGNATSQPHTINHTAGALTATAQTLLGHWGSETSVYNLSGGSFTQPDTVTNPISETQANFFIGIDGSGILNVSGTGVLNTTSLVVNGRGEGNNLGQDAVNLTGGRINLGRWGMRTQGSTYAVNLGGGIMGASADWTSALNMNLTGTGGNVTFNTLDSANNTTARSITLSGTLSGTGGLTKSGAGNLLLTGTKSYTGPTNVNGGTLFPGASFTSSILSVNTGGTLATGTPTTTGTSNITALTLNGGNASLRVDFTAGDLINANVFSVPTASTFSITPVSNVLPGDILTLVDYNGSIGGLGFAGLSLSPLPNPHYQASLVDDSVNTRVQVSIDAIDPVVWVGNVNSTWDVDSTSNWKTFSDDQTSKFYPFDVVSFTDEGSAAPNVNLVGSIQPISVTVDSTTDYTFSGVGISGTTGLEKKNSGTLTLLNNNTYTGITKVTAGTVRVGNGGTTGTLGGSGNVEIIGTLEINRSDATTLRRFIGGGTLVKNGAGSLTTSGATNDANVIVNAGTFVARGGGFSTGYLAGRTITVNAGATLDTAVHTMGSGVGGGGNPPAVVLNGGNWTLNGEQYIGSLTMTAGTTTRVGALDGIRTLGGSVFTINAAATSSIIDSPLTLFNNVNLAVADGAATNDLVVSGNISSSGIITKTGAGRLQITGTNTSTGGIALNGGSLEASSIADAGGVGSIGAYTTGLPGYLGIANDATFRYTGTGTQTSARNLWIDTGTQNKTIEVTSATGDITFSGTGGNINRPFTKTGPGALTLADVINVGATVTVNGGRLSLTGTNTYTGDTVVESGVLAVDGDAIANTNKLVINSGKVEPTGTEVVDTLFFGAVQQAAGTWGATGSGATNIDDTRFSGTGVVSVTSGPAGFGSWIGGFGLAVGDQDAGDDPDFDGIPNSVEFVLGGNPATGMDAALLPTIELVTTDLGAGSTDYLKFTFRRSDASVIDSPAVAQYDTDLTGTWTTAVNGTNGVVVQTNNDFYAAAPNGIDQVIYYIPRSLAAPGISLFGRLNVTTP